MVGGFNKRNRREDSVSSSDSESHKKIKAGEQVTYPDEAIVVEAVGDQPMEYEGDM